MASAPARAPARVPPALPRPRTPLGTLAALVALGAVGVSVAGTEFDLLALVAGARPTERFLGQLFPPDLSAATLRTVLSGLWETFQMSLLGTVVGAVLAAPLAVAATAEEPDPGTSRRRRTRLAVPYHTARLALNVFRSVPDILWALLFVVALGLGPFPGTLALAVHGAGVLGKLSSEALETVPSRPVQALAAIGATPFTRLLFGRLPQAGAAGGSLVLFQWECNIRSAAILGFVGAGGIGQEILISMNLFDYDRVATLAAATIVLVLAVDRGSAALRRRYAG